MDVLPGGMRRVTMPLPTRPGHVHCYLVPVEGGYMLVDTGLGLPDARERWAAELAGLDGPVVAIFLTPLPSRSLGAAGDVQALTGARSSRGGSTPSRQRPPGMARDSGGALETWFHRNGVPPAMSQELSEQMVLMRPFIRLVDDPVLLDDGDGAARLGGRRGAGARGRPAHPAAGRRPHRRGPPARADLADRRALAGEQRPTRSATTSSRCDTRSSWRPPSPTAATAT